MSAARVERLYAKYDDMAKDLSSDDERPPCCRVPRCTCMHGHGDDSHDDGSAGDDEVSDEDLDFVSQLGAPGLASLASLDQDALDR